jgi:hypothetical protein
MKKFEPVQLWFLLPGIGLVIASVLVPLNYLYKQLYWTPTEAVITGHELTAQGPDAQLLTLMDFTDEHGVIHHIGEDEERETFFNGADSLHVRVYYDPLNPADYELINPFRYVVLIFLPFGLLLCYLGWPLEKT